MGRVGIDDLEALQGLGLQRAERTELLTAQTECTFVFSSDAGWPSGVVMTFIHVDGVFWLTAVEGRSQTRGIERDPRATIVVSNAGTGLPGRRMAAYKCVVTVHRDRTTLDWFLGEFTKRLQPEDTGPWRKLLDSPNRVVFQARPVAVAVSHDSRKIPDGGRTPPGPAGAQPTPESTP